MPRDDDQLPIDQLFPENMRRLLNFGGQEFIERVGPESLRAATLHILRGDNVRTQTEPMTRQRIAEVFGAMTKLLANASKRHNSLFVQLSELSWHQLSNATQSDRASVWPAQWLLGITGKSTQNVLRSEPAAFEEYTKNFEETLTNAAESLSSEFGILNAQIDLDGESVSLSWVEYLRFLTAMGCAELAIRGSDKSRYGKLFERLVLGGLLSSLNLDYRQSNDELSARSFWLSDSTDDRECDGTAVVRPGYLARFDIRFIGIGNPEIVRDKLSRYARQAERQGISHSSITFIIVDRYPTGPRSNSLQLAEQSGSELIQMSMSCWPREVATRLHERLGFDHPLRSMSDSDVADYLHSSLLELDMLDFVPRLRSEQ
ncbi:MAG: CfrBI family restriction endonuclease [Planctomycetota bacterium]